MQEIGYHFNFTQLNTRRNIDKTILSQQQILPECKAKGF